jgi:hypothetical protein
MVDIFLSSDEMRPKIVVLKAAAFFDMHLGQITTCYILIF